MRPMESLDQYRKGWEERGRREEGQRAARTERARALLPELTRELVSRWGARRVVLVGSLARGELRSDSDIDLVVWGLRPEDVYDALAAVDRLAGEFDVDVIPWESATPPMRAVADEGEVLHGA